MYIHSTRLPNNVILGGGVRVRGEVREQRKIKKASKVLISLWTYGHWLPSKVSDIDIIAGIIPR